MGAKVLPSNRAVDVHSIAASHGIVVDESWELSTSGRIQWDEGVGAWTVTLRAQESFVRKRYTLAHEIGHFVLHLQSGRRKGSGVLHRTDEDNHTRLERQANQYAANLLMPAPAVKEAWDEGLTLEELAASFQVSIAAMGWRLHNLGLARLY